jgi:hypothetical protein
MLLEHEAPSHKRAGVEGKHKIMYFDSNSGICSRAQELSELCTTFPQPHYSPRILHIATSAPSSSMEEDAPDRA